MFNISSLLKKVSSKIEEVDLNIESIVFVLKKHTNISFNKNDLEIKNEELFINTTPTKKNILFIQKNNILADLKIYNIKNLR